MKSLSTFAIAVTLFVLCLLEKEAKQRDLARQKSNEYLADSLNINTPALDAPAYADLQNEESNFSSEKLPVNEIAISDSAATSLAPTPFLGKLPLLSSF